MIADVGCCSAARGGDDGDDAGADGEVNIETESDCEERYDEDATAEPDESAYKAGADRREKDNADCQRHTKTLIYVPVMNIITDIYLSNTIRE